MIAETAARPDHPASVQFLAPEAYSYLPPNRIQDTFKIWSGVQRLDTKGQLYRVASSATGQTSVAFLSELPVDYCQANRHCDAFLSSLQAMAVLGSEFPLQLRDVFIDRALSVNGNLKLWKVYESCPAFLHHGASDRLLSFPERGCVVTAGQNDFLTVLFELTKFFRQCEQFDLIPNLMHLAVGVKGGRYRLLLQGFVPKPPMLRPIRVHQIFEEESQPEWGAKRGFFNKLEIQKSSHRTAESFETEPPRPDPEPQTPKFVASNCVSPRSQHYLVRPSPTPKLDTQVLDQRARTPFDFAVAVTYEMAKNQLVQTLPFSNPGQNDIDSVVGHAKDDKLARLFEAFDLINASAGADLTLQTVDSWLAKMKEHLSHPTDTFYAFKDDAIALARRPLFKALKMVRLQLTEQASDQTAAASTIAWYLAAKRLRVLELVLNGVQLTGEELEKVFSSLALQKGLARLSLECVENELTPTCIKHLCATVQQSPLTSISLNFAEWANQHGPPDQLLLRSVQLFGPAPTQLDHGLRAHHEAVHVP